MLNILSNRKESGGKVLIYHHDLSGTGIYTIAEVLKFNGFNPLDGR